MGFHVALLGNSKAPNTPFWYSFPGMGGLLAQHEREATPLVAEMQERYAAHTLSALTTATLTELVLPACKQPTSTSASCTKPLPPTPGWA